MQRDTKSMEPQPQPQRHDMDPLFDAYLMVDWSASKTPKTGSDSIWFALLERTKSSSGPAPRAVASLQNPDTRCSARTLLGKVLKALRACGKRVLVGFDFPFGYPRGAARAFRLPTCRPAWCQMWREVDSLVRDGPKNLNNRFCVANELNKRVCADGPFWGKPQGEKYDDLEHLSTGKPQTYPDDLPEKRLCEERVPGPQPVWKLNGAGSVGGQTLTGLPVVRALRNDEAEGCSAIWPFETGLRSLKAVDIKKHPIVFAEIYPSLLEQPKRTPMIKDAWQVLAIAQHFAALDEQGALGNLFEGDPTLLREEREHVEHEEGWILGVKSECRKQRLPEHLPLVVLEHGSASNGTLHRLLQELGISFVSAKPGDDKAVCAWAD